MLIRNVNIYTEEKRFQYGNITVCDGVFAKKGQDCGNRDEVIDGGGCYAIPGLVDIHFHGCDGYDFCDGTEEAIRKIAEYEASAGVTAIVPATMTLPVEELEAILKNAADYQPKSGAEADLLGINMEGPFISPVKKGAQDAKNIIPCSVEAAKRFMEASKGLVTFIGVAPEEQENASEFIKEMRGQVHISLAHTNADYDAAKAAFDAGADHAVHLYNAMPAFSHREPGVVGAVADSEHVMAELICDGVHIHPAAVRTTLKMLGEDRVVFISDSMRATGMKDGLYTLGGLEVSVKGNRATLVSDGSLAGSVTNLLDCLRTAVTRMGVPLETAVACATANPAKSAGIYDRYGSITPGKKGNLVLLNKDLSLRAVIKDGKVL